MIFSFMVVSEAIEGELSWAAVEIPVSRLEVRTVLSIFSLTLLSRLCFIAKNESIIIAASIRIKTDR